MINWLYGVIEKFLKGRREKKYSKNVYFKPADDHSEGLLPIEILQGPFAGTIFTITEFKILDDYGRCEFEHKILRKQPGVHDSYYARHQFTDIVGEIIMVVLGQVTPNYVGGLNNEELSDDAEDGDAGIVEEPVEERTKE
jgi:hypothetical protein